LTVAEFDVTPARPDISDPSGLPEELHRYHRQMLLTPVGTAGQRRLRDAHVLLVGCGALGSVIADSLVRAGVGAMRIVDRDVVEITNLQRQVLFDEADVAGGVPKAEAARVRLAAINGGVDVTAHVDDFNHRNAERYVEGVDLILDGLDNFETRYLLNDLAVRHRLPYVYGGAVGVTGMAMTILPGGPHARPRAEATIRWTDAESTPCLRCVFPDAPPPGTTPTCDTAGVLGAAVLTVAAHQSAEAIKLLTGNLGAVDRSLLSLDLWHNEARRFGVGEARRDSCPCCGQGRFGFLEGEGSSVASSLCGRNAVQITTADDGGGSAIDLASMARRLAPHGAFTQTDHLLRGTFEHERTEAGEPISLTLFPNGRAVIVGTAEPDAARALYAKYVGSRDGESPSQVRRDPSGAAGGPLHRGVRERARHRRRGAGGDLLRGADPVREAARAQRRAAARARDPPRGVPARLRSVGGRGDRAVHRGDRRGPVRPADALPPGGGRGGAAAGRANQRARPRPRRTALRGDADDAHRGSARRRRPGARGPRTTAAALGAGALRGDARSRLELEPPALDAIAGPTRHYESELTAALRRLHEKTKRLVATMFDRAEAAGVAAGMAGDPRDRNRSIAETRAIWSETAAALAREAARIGALNRRTVDTFRLMLPDDAGFELHARYYARAYRDLRADPDSTGRRFESALERTDLDAGAIDEIDALHRAWRAEDARVVEAAAEVIDRRRLLTGSASPDLMAARERLKAALDAVLTSRGRASETARAALESVLDAAVTNDSDGATAGAGSSNAGTSGDGSGPGDDPAPRAAPGVATGAPPAISLRFPGPMTTRDLEHAARRLGLDETARAIADTMHADYLEAYRALDAGADRALLRRLRAELWSPDPETGAPRPPAPDRIARIYTLHRAALAAIGHADASLFENLQALAGADDAGDAVTMERLRLGRRREVHRAGTASHAGGDAHGYLRTLVYDETLSEADVDVPRLLRDIDGAGADRQAIDLILLEHERIVTPLVVESAEWRLRCEEALQVLAADRTTRSRATDARGRPVPRYGARYHELMTGPARSFGALRRDLVAHNRAALRRLEEALPPEAAHALADGYARASFPGAFNDTHALGTTLAAALSFPDLGGSRRSSIENLAAEYTPAWYELSRRMAEAHHAADPGDSRWDHWTERAERQRRVDRIRRERDDLNHRTRLQLRALLLPEQAARLGLDGAADGPKRQR
jgi:adenylyltransferase/sulfurtransferase